MSQNPIIAKIPLMTREQRYAAAKNATRFLSLDDPRKADAEAILGAIDAYEIEYFEPRRMTVGLLEWEPHDGQYVMRGFYEGKVVATITYTDTHTAGRKNVFALRVGGVERGELFHHVADAREASARIFAEERGTS
ncbi:hypothetical protein [Sedimentimonas flavescens]|uniref:hypothetical protein n=1 Tax=Sedimentimonas flavescens TaxID=2851012 RepID=UPI001C49D4CD|nr:hypothetical protein [Sedimentimonas flavescens]MBW0157614.1 hypothetical protein [Sedimentimonas flavescens]